MVKGHGHFPLIFVYNAATSPLNALVDSAYKLLSPQSVTCHLCTLTYGLFSMRREWKQYLDGLVSPVELLHRDEFEARYGSPPGALPAVFIPHSRGIQEWISAGEINRCSSLQELIDLVEDRRSGSLRSTITHSITLPAAPAVEPALHLRLEKLVDLAHRFSPGDPFLAARIELAAQDPKRYLFSTSAAASILEPVEPPSMLPWRALIDGLSSRGLLVLIDWQAPPEDVLVQLALIFPPSLGAQYWQWFDLDAWKSQPTVDFLIAVGKRLRIEGWVLASLTQDGNSYALFLAQPAMIRDLTRLAVHSGYGSIECWPNP